MDDESDTDDDATTDFVVARCERCGGVYRLRNRGGVYEVEARYEVEAGEE